MTARALKELTKQFLTLSLLLLIAPFALAQSELNENNRSNSQSASSSPSQRQGTRKGAGAAKFAQLIGVGSNLAMGAVMMKPCMAQPSCPYCCAAAAMSFANGASMLANSQQSGQTEDLAMEMPDWDNLFANDSDFASLGIDDVNNTDELKDRIQLGLADAKKLGYSYDPTTNLLTTPENGSFTPEVLSDPQAAAAQGFSPSEMSFGQGEMLAVAEKLKDKAAALDKLNSPSVSGVKFDSGGGGAGAGAYAGASFDSGVADYLAKMKRGLASKKKAVIAGKSKNFGGEQIGVKVDNLFEMVHRRYQAKRRANTFLENVVTKKK